MSKPRHKPPSGRTNLASCIVATIFLIFVIIIILIVFFTVFKPRDPQISVNAVQLPTFSLANSTVNFTFSQYVSVKNPNRAVFTHYASTLQLLYSGSQIGFMFIPAGKIDANLKVRARMHSCIEGVRRPGTTLATAVFATSPLSPPMLLLGGSTDLRCQTPKLFLFSQLSLVPFNQTYAHGPFLF
ncbi:hypothetical protein CsSME_00010179 [Camellia sinensis var. sinensis]|uniref:uncharacterized protein LOC114283452 n=1 Tax=Camellia sinensis TaxID=4442 RepID=UPI00103557B9|nr:uncharacterized protein LOC114283452 [Camellia sinensis]